jgi:hypothetical protein
MFTSVKKERAAQHPTITYATVTNLTRGVEGFGHKLHMDNFVSSLDLGDDFDSAKKFPVVGQ